MSVEAISYSRHAIAYHRTSLWSGTIISCTILNRALSAWLIQVLYYLISLCIIIMTSGRSLICTVLIYVWYSLGVQRYELYPSWRSIVGIICAFYRPKDEYAGGGGKLVPGKRIRKRSDSVLWRKPLYQQKITKKKTNENTKTITQRLQTDVYLTMI